MVLLVGFLLRSSFFFGMWEGVYVCVGKVVVIRRKEKIKEGKKDEGDRQNSRGVWLTLLCNERED